MIDILLDRARTGLENLENPAILFWHFQDQKVLEKKTTGPGKINLSPGKILEICFWKGVRTLLDRLIFFGFFFSSFSVFFPSLYKFKKCLVHKRVKKIRFCN